MLSPAGVSCGPLYAVRSYFGSCGGCGFFVVVDIIYFCVGCGCGCSSSSIPSFVSSSGTVSTASIQPPRLFVVLGEYCCDVLSVDTTYDCEVPLLLTPLQG